jgi:hypothetical protein
MILPERIRGLMIAVRQVDFDVMPPAERRRFADLARHIAGMAEPKPAPAKAGGVLADLKQGMRGE